MRLGLSHLDVMEEIKDKILLASKLLLKPSFYYRKHQENEVPRFLIRGFAADIVRLHEAANWYGDVHKIYLNPDV